MGWLDLPELALIRVLNYLPVHDQLNARLVCRHWKLINDSSARRDELVLFLEIYPRPVYWFHDGREVDLGNAFLFTSLASLKSEFFLSYFRKLRRLMIAHQPDTSSDEFIEQIQVSFLQLEHLQFSLCGPKCCFSGIRRLVFESNLKLPNLRTFYSQAGDMPLGLHCPKLNELFVYSELTINETTDDQTKECLQNLRLLHVQKLTFPGCFEFSNLEIFYFNKPSPIFLSAFPRLKKIFYFNGTSGFREGIKDALENLLEQKRSLKRNQLRVYFDGVELNGRDDCEAYRYPNGRLWSLDLNAHVLQLIKAGSPILELNLLCKDLQMSDQLDDELVGLQEEHELVESMLKSAAAIRFEQTLSKKSLNLFDLSDRFRYVSYVAVFIELSQALLDQLPAAFPHLLQFYYHPEFFGSHFLNFKFIARIKSLHAFRVNHRLISIDEIRFIFKNCKFIDFVWFERLNFVGIRAIRDFRYKDFRVTWTSSDGVKFARATFTAEELLDYLEASRWVKKNDFLGEREEEEEPELILRPDQDEDD